MALSLLIVIDGQRGGGELFVLLCLTIVVAVISARLTGIDAKYFLRSFLDLEVARKADHMFCMMDSPLFEYKYVSARFLL